MALPRAPCQSITKSPWKVYKEPRKSHKEDQEDQRTLKALGRVPLARVILHGSPGLPSGSPPGLPVNPSHLHLPMGVPLFSEGLQLECGGLTGSPWNSQKEGQDDQRTFRDLGRVPLALLSLPGPPGLPSGSTLGPLSIHHSCIRIWFSKRFSKVSKEPM